MLEDGYRQLGLLSSSSLKGTIKVKFVNVQVKINMHSPSLHYIITRIWSVTSHCCMIGLLFITYTFNSPYLSNVKVVLWKLLLFHFSRH